MKTLRLYVCLLLGLVCTTALAGPGLRVDDDLNYCHRQVQRATGIVRTSATGGYYVDIFRSHRKDGNDKMHDYFYHNLGQRMTLTAADGSSLNLRPTDDLAFAGGHLYAYSYIYDKKGAPMTKNVKAQFTVNDSITMTMWMKADKQRKVYQALRLKLQPSGGAALRFTLAK